MMTLPFSIIVFEDFNKVRTVFLLNSICDDVLADFIYMRFYVMVPLRSEIILKLESYSYVYLVYFVIELFLVIYI